MVFYGVLDLFAKPVFAIVHLWSVRRIDYSALQLSSGKHSDFTVLKGDVPAANAPLSSANKPVEKAGETTAHNGADSTVHGH